MRIRRNVYRNSLTNKGTFSEIPPAASVAITKPVPVSLSLCLHPQTLFLASEESVVGQNVLLVEDSQGGLPDILGTLTLVMGLGFSSQSSRPAGRARSTG